MSLLQLIDRLGLDIDLPVTIISSNLRDSKNSLPSNRIESLKLAAQWSFWFSINYILRWH